jgi:hypothetical protein
MNRLTTEEIARIEQGIAWCLTFITDGECAHHHRETDHFG